jgi:hypothetical protein
MHYNRDAVKTLANQRASRFRTIQVCPKDFGPRLAAQSTTSAVSILTLLGSAGMPADDHIAPGTRSEPRQTDSERFERFVDISGLFAEKCPQ